MMTTINSTEKRSMPTASKRTRSMMIPLSQDFTPGPRDVIVYCAKGSHQIKNHPGNKRYKAILQHALVRYARANTKFQQWHLLTQIVTMIRLASNNSNGGGSFVAQDEVSGQWYQMVGETLVHEIVESNLRKTFHRTTKRANRARRIGFSPATEAIGV